MNKYVKIGLTGFVIGALLTAGYILYKRNSYDGKQMKPTSKIETHVNTGNNLDNPYTLVKKNKTMA